MILKTNIKIGLNLDTSLGKKTNTETYYLKPVIAWVPHKILPKSIFSCLLCPNCKDSVEPKGWQTHPEARLIHGMHNTKFIDYRISNI